MNRCLYYWCVKYCLVFLGLIIGTVGRAQELFDQDEVLRVKLNGPINEVLKDRGDDAQYHDLMLNYESPNGQTTTVPVRVRVRGNFRRLKSNCVYPPLMLNFSAESVKGTLFEHQDKMKLVMPCQGDKFVVREYLVYELYNLFTPRSFRARLIQVQFDDPALKSKNTEPFYGILLEEENQMAARNNMLSVERMLVRPEQTMPEDFLTLAVFEYLIANTDWSVQYRQNIKLIATDTLSRTFTVPYDFDHAGIVGAPYAKPAPELMLSSVRERRYRGYCLTEMKHFEKILDKFNELKESIYSVYTSNTLLDDNYKKSTVKFLDDFYRTINDPKKVKEEFQYPCRSDGTGNVVIKGLKN
ncbi:MAG: hypothetical protein MUC73_14135 [Cyclobacteriaceae bacterium]|nr:hypothetical protein [Cyclobacteriaceae bacterium]